MTYISIPEETEAICFGADTLGQIPVFTKCTNFSFSVKDGKYNCLITVNGGEKLLVTKGDYILRDKGGNISVMKAAVFQKKYIEKGVD